MGEAVRKNGADTTTLDAAVLDATRAAVLDALIASGGRREHAALRLGVSKATLQRRMRSLWTAEQIEALRIEHGWPSRAEIAAGASAEASRRRTARAADDTAEQDSDA
jgi:hypothetical protein